MTRQERACKEEGHKYILSFGTVKGNNIIFKQCTRCGNCMTGKEEINPKQTIGRRIK